MPKVLTDEQVLQYRANGYLFPLDALNGNEVVALRSQLAADGEPTWWGLDGC